MKKFLLIQSPDSKKFTTDGKTVFAGPDESVFVLESEYPRLADNASLKDDGFSTPLLHLSREDIENAGFQAGNLSNQDLKKFADQLFMECIMEDFREAVYWKAKSDGLKIISKTK